MIVADECTLYTLTFEEAIRAMLDGKYAAAEDINSVFRFNTRDGFQHRTYDGKGNLIWKQTLAFLGGDLPRRKWMVIDEAIFDPCPFCGNSYISHSTHNEEDGVRVQIVCKECDSEFTLRGKDLVEIRDRWGMVRR